jgi:DNA-binding PadR family transcriptional regulator
MPETESDIKWKSCDCEFQDHRKDLSPLVLAHLQFNKSYATICRRTTCRYSTYKDYPMPSEKDLPEIIPLTEATFLILLSLAPGPRHGYAIMKDVHTLSNGRIALSTGTLYGALKRMLAQGWIVRVEECDPGTGTTEGGRQRKAYNLTTFGRDILRAETDRLKNLAGLATLRTHGVQS